MVEPSHAHELFLLMARLGQTQEPEHIWELFLDGLNGLGLGVTFQRTEMSTVPGSAYLPVRFEDTIFGSVVMDGTDDLDEDTLSLIRAAVASLGVALRARRASLELDDARLLAQRILDTTPDFIHIQDLGTGENIYVNRSLQAYLGYTSDEPFEQLLHPDDLDAVREHRDRLTRVSDERDVSEVEYRLRSKNGHWRWLRTRETVFSRDADGSLARKIGASVDITEQRATAERLGQAQKMEAVGRLAGGLAHDFNNALCAISGNAELTLLELSPEGQAREPLLSIISAAARATALTQQLMAFAGKQILQPTLVNLSELIEGMHLMLAGLLGKSIVLQTEPEAQLEAISCDPGQLEQLIVTLVLHARDAMPDGGELRIETANLPPRGEVMLELRDSGVGMSDEVRARIFEPFFSTTEFGQGAGIGLATVLGIVEQSGGRIDISSEAGEGSCFRLYFPCVPTGVGAGATAPSPAIVGGRETLLIVDDESMLRGLAQRFLTGLGYEVLTASCGTDAIKLAKNYDGHIDLLLVDVVMPELNGRKVAEQLTQLQPGLTVLYMSGFTRNIIGHHGVLGADTSFLAKPYSRLTLSAAVREALDHPKDPSQ